MSICAVLRDLVAVECSSRQTELGENYKQNFRFIFWLSIMGKEGQIPCKLFKGIFEKITKLHKVWIYENSGEEIVFKNFLVRNNICN